MEHDSDGGASTSLPNFSSASTRELIDFGLQHVIQRKRLIEIIARALDACAEKPLRDRYLIDILAQSIEGAVVQICSAAEWVQQLLRHIRAGRLGDFRRSSRADSSIAANATLATPEVLASFDFLFPDAAQRGSDRPNAADVIAVEQQVREGLAPLRSHRDKLLAHWDPGTHVPATWGDLLGPLLALEQLLSKMWAVHTREVYLIETKSPHSRESTSDILANAILR